MALCIAGFVGLFMSPQGPLTEYFALRTTEFAQRPWTFLTYPFLHSQPFFFFLLLMLWTFSMGSPLERELGTKRYLAFFGVATLLGAICFLIGIRLTNQHAQLDGMLLPVSCLSVAWATRNRSAVVQFMMIVPLAGQWIGWISAGVVLFDLGRYSPLVGLVCLVPLVLSYLFAADKLPLVSWRGRPKQKAGPRGKFYSDAYYDDVKKREQERDEKEKLRKLFEKSFGEEDKR